MTLWIIMAVVAWAYVVSLGFAVDSLRRRVRALEQRLMAEELS